MRLIFLGFDCNNHCVFCSQGALGAASPASASKNGAPVSSGKEIAFVGGEPTLSERLFGAVSAAKKSGTEWVLVQTNARRLCYPDYARGLLAAGVDALDVSLQGSTPAMHDYHTQVPGSWVQTVAGMRQAKKIGLPFGVSTVITRSNFRHLAEILRLAHSSGAQAIRFEPAEAYGRAAAARDRVVPTPELVAEEIIAASREAARLGVGLCVYGKASSPAALRFFAGIGEHNETPAPTPAPAADSAPAPQKRGEETRVRPKPGLREVHVREKITGEALRVIFPKLFAPEQTETHG
jgi:MoaA/NifB/PqqE/SkfB family radical SAM enzyme